jgi:hypothetical protein
MFLAQLTSLSKPARVVYVVDTPIDYTLAETLAVQNNALCVLASQLVATLATLSKPIKCVFLARNSQHHVFQALAESVHAQVSAFEWADYSEKEIEVALVRTAIPQVKYLPRTTFELAGQDSWFPRLVSAVTYNRLSAEGKIPMTVLVGPSGTGKSSSIEHTLLWQLNQQSKTRRVTLHTIDCTLAFQPTQAEVAEGVDQYDSETSESIMRKAMTALRQFVTNARLSVADPTKDLFILNFDSLENVPPRDTKWLAWLEQCAFIASRAPANTILVGSCNDWFMPKNAFLRALRSDQISTIKCTRIDVPLVSPVKLESRIAHWFRHLRPEKISLITSRARGCMCLAVQMAATHELSLDVDPNDSRSPVDRMREWIFAGARQLDAIGARMVHTDPFPRSRFANGARLVAKKYHIPSHAMLYELEDIEREERESTPIQLPSVVKPKLVRSADLFASLDNAFFDVEVNQGSDTIRNNYPYFCTAGHPPRSQAAVDQLMGLADAADCASMADLYEFEQRRTGYAGSDGVETDADILSTLAISGPLVSLVARARSARAPMTQLPTQGKVYRSTKDYDMRTLLESNQELVRIMSASAYCASTGTDVSQSLALRAALKEEESNEFVAKGITLDQIDHASALARLSRSEDSTGAGFERCRRIGLDKKESIELAMFARSLSSPKPTLRDLTKQYSDRVNSTVDLVFDRPKLIVKMSSQSVDTPANRHDAAISLAFGTGAPIPTLSATASSSTTTAAVVVAKKQKAKTLTGAKVVAKKAAAPARKRKRAIGLEDKNSKVKQTTLKF